MNKKGNVIIGIMIFVLILNFISNSRIRREMSDLQNQISRLRSDINTQERNLENSVEVKFDAMDELLRKSQSYFTETSVNMSLKGKKSLLL